MFYLNNAATTFPKPQAVMEAQLAALSSPPVNPFRSSSFRGGKDLFEACRENLGKLLGISDVQRIFFASGATDALNRLLFGLQLSDLPVVVTQTEHNSILRPLYSYPFRTGKIYFVPCNEWGKVEPADAERMLEELESDRKSPYAGLLIVNHCSNVTGMIQDVEALGAIARRHRFLFMLDVSQSAGALPVSADAWGVDLLAFTGHKALFGPPGTGGYYVRREIPFRPLLFGGTGRDSRKLVYDEGDYEYEVGTQNSVGIAGLNAGIEYVLGKGIGQIADEEQRKMRKLYQALSNLPRVLLYGRETLNGGPLLSFNIQGMKPFDVGYILENAYQITVRTGLHCSPLIHQALHTETHGTVRVSISDLTTSEEINCFLKAVSEIAGGEV